MPPVASSLARDILAAAVLREGAYTAYNHTLHVRDADRRELAALLPVMSGVTVDEWTGEEGTRYRDYIGQLASGLRLRVGTDPQRVPLVDVERGRRWSLTGWTPGIDC